MDKYFPTTLQQVIFFEKYSRYNYDLGRRETWPETVKRAVDFLRELGGTKISPTDYDAIHLAILHLEVMPSMRLIAMAGPASRRQNLCIYNCSYVNVDDIAVFGELMLISMNGCGIGFSVQKKNVNKLPDLPKTLTAPSTLMKQFIVPDTTEGWKEAIDYLFKELYGGLIPMFDYSQIRPAGTPLKIKGGTASGAESLMTTISFIIDTFLGHYKRSKWSSRTQEYKLNGDTKLHPIELHDICCSIGNAAVSGGVRRTAGISLFDKDDEEMYRAKKGQYNKIRYNANNSVIFEDDLTQSDLLNIMSKMAENGTGEPGFYSLYNARNTSPSRRIKEKIMGVNACGESNLRSKGLCNLSAVIARKDDTIKSLADKVRLATIIGTIQTTASYFPGLRKEWQLNCEEERLLGVDITGQADCELLIKDSGEVRQYLRTLAVSTNKAYAEKLGINQAAAVTCNKPSGNTSQLCDCSSGIHPRFSPYYIRRIKINKQSPVFAVLVEAGYNYVDSNEAAIFSFPVRAPEGAITRKDVTAIQMCEIWKNNKVNYTEHNPSVTIYYKEDELIPLVNWLWQNKDILSGMCFLPYDNNKYENMPYEEIGKETYLRLVEEQPKTVNWDLLQQFEKTDTTEKDYECSGDTCKIS